MYSTSFLFFQILRFLGFIVTPDFGDRSVTIHQLLPVFVISLLLEDLSIVSYQKWARGELQSPRKMESGFLQASPVQYFLTLI